MEISDETRRIAGDACPGELVEVGDPVVNDLVGQEKLLTMCTSNNFVAGKWAATAEQKAYYREVLDCGPMISNWLEFGYRVPFHSLPDQPLEERNNKSARDRLSFVREEIGNLLKSGVIREAAAKPMIVNPLSAVYSNKWRLVFDCRLLNQFVTKRKIQLEDHRDVPGMVKRGDWGFCEDLKSGYWQIPLREDQRTFFGCEGDGVYYEACVLIFGVTG